MKRILIRSAQNPLYIYPPYESTKKIGGNSGNLLYAHAVSRILSSRNNILSFGGFKSHISKNKTQWIENVNRKHDHYVMPMSNIFRLEMTEGLKSFTEIIKNLSIPVTVVGIGVQATAGAYHKKIYTPSNSGDTEITNTLQEIEINNHNHAIFDFCQAVLEKSHSIGVRGVYSKNYLVSIGIPDHRIKIIGCPSLYTWGPNLRITNKNNKAFNGKKQNFDSNADISMNIDYRIPGIERMIYTNIHKYSNITSPSQDSKSARMIIKGEDFYDLDSINLETPVHINHEMFTKKSLVYYPNPWGWIKDLSKKQFVFGTRLHGNIAAILGKTPAHLIAHDSRTYELAEFARIPHSPYGQDNNFLAEDLFYQTDYEEFNDVIPTLFANFIEFLKDNDLSSIYEFDNGCAGSFDEQILELEKISGIYPT